MVAHVKEGREAEYLKNVIMQTALRDPAALEDVERAFKDLNRARDTFRFKNAQENIAALCKRVGIDKSDYGAMFDLKNPAHRAETESRLANHVHEQAGGFRRAVDWAEKLPLIRKLTPGGFVIPGSSRDSAIRAVMEANRITPNMRSNLSPTSWVLDTVDKSLHSIGNHLEGTVGSQEVRDMLTQEAMTNQPSKFENERGPRTFEQVQGLEREQRNTVPKMKDRITQFMETDPEYRNAQNPIEQDRALSRLKQSEMKESAGTGFFAWLWSIVFTSNFNKAATQATNRSVNIH
jgi:hypothetical protein